MNQIIELDGIEYVTSSDAAKYLGISRSQVSNLCKLHKLTPHKVGSKVLIPFHEVRRYKALEGTSARKPGRNPK